MSVGTDPNSDDPHAQTYRAISTPGGRRGIRLENAYWAVLNELADEQNQTLGQLIEVVRVEGAEAKNLTSLLRVNCLVWLRDKLHAISNMSDDRMIRSILNAVPTPAIALASGRNLQAFNQPFLSLVTDAFDVTNVNALPAGLRLVMDVQIDKLIEQLQANENRPIQVGIAIGVDERRFRQQLRVILAPKADQKVILGFLEK